MRKPSHEFITFQALINCWHFSIYSAGYMTDFGDLSQKIHLILPIFNVG